MKKQIISGIVVIVGLGIISYLYTYRFAKVEENVK